MVHPLPSFATILGTDSTDDDTFALTMSGSSGSKGYLSFVWRAAGSKTLTLDKDILTMASARWVHVALVLDRPSGRARWFVDGKLERTMIASLFGPILGSARTMFVGCKSHSYWSLDEVRVSLRAVPAAEIQAWASAEPAAHVRFEAPCHPVGRPVMLEGTGGLPVIGNGAYALTVYGLPQSVVALGMGSNNRAFGAANLPLDLRVLDRQLSGCFLRSSVDVVLFGRIGPTGALPFALPIPNLPAASGTKLYSQALLTSSILNATMLTNAHALVVGR